MKVKIRETIHGTFAVSAERKIGSSQYRTGALVVEDKQAIEAAVLEQATRLKDLFVAGDARKALAGEPRSVQ